MASFYVSHHEYPRNPKLFTVNVELVVKRVGEPNTQFYYKMRGEEFWELYVGVDAVDASGDDVPPFWADVVTTEADVETLVADKVEELCALIDWSNEGEFAPEVDTTGPILVSATPVDGSTDVEITSKINVVIKEPLPSSGMDISTLTFKVKGIAVTPTVTGHPYKYTIEFSPSPYFG